MELNWSGFEGQRVDGNPLNSFLGVRDERAYYVTQIGAKAAPALIQLLPASSPRAPLFLDSWSRAAMLSHDNLVHVYSAGEGVADGIPVAYGIAQLPDDDLSEILPKRALDRREAKSILTSVAKALEYLHGNGLAHGAVQPENIFAVGEQSKLGVDTVHGVGEGDQRTDIRQLGAAAIEVFGGKKGAGVSEVPELDGTMAEIVSGCLSPDPSWTAARVLQRLSERTPPPAIVSEPEPDSTTPTRRWPWVAALAAVGVVAIMALTRSTPEKTAKAPEAPAVVQRQLPSPTARTVTPETTPVPETPAKTETRGRTVPAGGMRPGWAVIVATYGSFGGAEKRAKAVAERWPKFQVRPEPAEGQGTHYFVSLGSGLSKKEALSIQARARAAGMPRDTYVTTFK